MVLQNYQNLIELTSKIFIIIAIGVGFKCPRKIYLNTQCGGVARCQEMATLPAGYIPRRKLSSASSNGSLGFIVCEAL